MVPGVVEGIDEETLGNGCAICIIVNEAVALCAMGDHPRWLPRTVSSVNGTRNLSEALSHSQ
jgi:hypothetical protein